MVSHFLRLPPNLAGDAAKADVRQDRAAPDPRVLDYAASAQSAEIIYLQDYLAVRGMPPAASDVPIVFANTVVSRSFKMLEQRAREFWWTLTRLVGLGWMHDGSLRPAALRPSRETHSAPSARALESPRILIDATRTWRSGLHTGVQRVVRRVADRAVADGLGLPVVLDGDTLRPFYRSPVSDTVDVQPGDILLLLDLPVLEDLERLLDKVRNKGCRVIVLIYDLIPLLYPALCAPRFPEYFRATIDAILSHADGVVAISRTVAVDVARHVAADPRLAMRDIALGWAHLGADFAGHDAGNAADLPVAGHFFLGVGTIEPRKAWSVAIEAMERLWDAGETAALVLVGRYGWSSLSLRERIRQHPEFGRRLVWLDDADDATLAALYRNAVALVYPSVCEGFGLPLIEARHYGTPVIASDIPVFREIAGDSIRYVPLLDKDALAKALIEALDGHVPVPAFATLDWSTASERLLQLVRDIAEDAPNPQRL